jgi:lipid-A-disaccharide synthase
MENSNPLKIGIIAGEASGDVLGAGLIRSLKQQYPNCEIVGIGGQHLIAEGLRSMFDMNELSVMGLVEVLKHLPRLLSIRKQMVQFFLDNPPDVFIGVDAPDFNLAVESKLKAQGIKTVHYVSPTVWAWRESRIHKIAKATDLVLGIFPFEHLIYDKYQVPYRYVGHTLADTIPMQVDQAAARAALSISADKHVLAILPGSRTKEIASLLPIFLETASLYAAHKDSLKIVIPAANQSRLAQIETLLAQSQTELDILVTSQPAREAMIAADAVLLTSGTASLEAMLCKRPMAVAYKMSALTYRIMQHMYKPAYFALPNILADQMLVPELLQEQVNPATLCEHLLEQQERNQVDLQQAYCDLHEVLRTDADLQSAKAVLELAGRKSQDIAPQ